MLASETELDRLNPRPNCDIRERPNSTQTPDAQYGFIQQYAHARGKKKPADLPVRAKSNLFTELEETDKLYRSAAYSNNLLFKYKLFKKHIIKLGSVIW